MSWNPIRWVKKKFKKQTIIDENLIEIRNLAESIRDVFEIIAKEENYYSNLRGLCARASIQLFLESKKRGIEVDLVAGSGHVYNAYKNQLIDITGTQFGHSDRVVIFPFSKRKKLGPAYVPRTRVKSLEKIFSNTWETKKEEIEKDNKAVTKYILEHSN